MLMCPELDKEKKLPKICYNLGSRSTLLQLWTQYVVFLEGPEEAKTGQLVHSLDKLYKQG
jgi:hypothetical protein